MWLLLLLFPSLLVSPQNGVIVQAWASTATNTAAAAASRFFVGRDHTRLASSDVQRQHHDNSRNIAPQLRLSSSSSSSSSDKENSNLLETLLNWFQGEFDNYRQCVEDRQNNLLPKEGGGHEHIHCTLVPVTRDSRLAAFFFDGVPTAIFRFRFYRLEPAAEEETMEAVDTILYTLAPELEGKLRACSDDPLQWPSIFRTHVLGQQKEQSTDAAMEDDITQSAIALDCVRLLPKCDVRWSWRLDPVLHAYAAQEEEQSHHDGIHAVMVHGQAVVESQMLPGQSILIKDQLSLWPDQLWIHDRGFDPDTGAYIYGNQRDVPYVLQRVADIAAASDNDGDDTKRVVVDDALAWTLGANYRTLKEYEDNMAVIGGPSRPPRPSPPPAKD